MEQNWSENREQVIAGWYSLNTKGKILWVACVMNSACAMVLAFGGSPMAVFSIIMAAYCGMLTYHPRYQYQDANDINEKRKK